MCSAIFYNSLANFGTCEFPCIWIPQFLFLFVPKYISIHNLLWQITDINSYFYFSFHSEWTIGICDLLIVFVLEVGVYFLFFLQFFSSWRLKYELLHSVDKFFINYVHWMADLIGKMSENYAVNKVFIMNMHRKSPFQLFQYFEPLILKTWLHSSE